jgi:hypothetical protein
MDDDNDAWKAFYCTCLLFGGYASSQKHECTVLQINVLARLALVDISTDHLLLEQATIWSCVELASLTIRTIHS